MGCASKGFVLEEIQKSKSETTAELSKQLKESIGKFEMDVSKRIANIEANYALKSEMDSKDYDMQQKITKDIDAKLNDIKKGISDLSAMKEETMTKLSQNLQSSVQVLLRQLKEQKDGVERAIEELEKFMSTQPATQPPAEQPK